jgi:hypothetical protein
LLQQLQIGSWLLTVDPETARLAYAQSVGSQCDCSGCRNFRTVRSLTFSPDFSPDLLSLFDKLGIDPQKEQEIYDLGLVNDELGQWVRYGGWYHFVGHIDRVGNTPIVLDRRWSVWFTHQIALPEPAFRNLQLSQLEIAAKIPWVLSEPYSP